MQFVTSLATDGTCHSRIAVVDGSKEKKEARPGVCLMSSSCTLAPRDGAPSCYGSYSFVAHSSGGRRGGVNPVLTNWVGWTSGVESPATPLAQDCAQHVPASLGLEVRQGDALWFPLDHVGTLLFPILLRFYPFSSLSRAHLAPASGEVGSHPLCVHLWWMKIGLF